MSDPTLQHVSLHNINLELKKVIPRNIGVDDAKNYIITLSRRMLTYNNIREYHPKSLTSEVVSKILEICISFKAFQQSASTSNSGAVLSLEPLNTIIAQKLLNEQLIAQSKYKQLTEINKGSLIQSLLESEGEYIYILALVEHTKFIDEKDLKYKSGMPDSDKVALKSARIHLTKEGIIKKIFLSDSHPKISEYWYDGFLDLVEAKDNIRNTKIAYDALRTVLKDNLSYKYPADYAELKNTLNVYFTHKDNYLHTECVEFLLDSYIPTATELNVIALKDKLLDTSLKFDFDNTFTLNTKSIENKLKNTKYKVNDNIELKIKKPVEKLQNCIYTYNLPTGEKTLIIKNVDKKILEKFNFNNVDLE